MSKFFKRIAKDSVKFTADFVATELDFVCEEDSYVRVQVRRGDNKPTSLAPIFLRGSGMSRDVQQVRF